MERLNGVVISNKEYRKHEGISKSDLHILTKSPAHFKYAMEHRVENDSAALLFGRAAHKAVLEPETFCNEFCIEPELNKRTKEGKQAYELFLLENEGKDVISKKDAETVLGMRDAISKHKFASKLLTGVYEKSFFWKDEATGEMCKCRPDCITKIGDQYICVDYKTASDAETTAFMRSAIQNGYDLQAAMYTEGLKANTGEDFMFVFVAQEKKPPYAINILQADEFFIREGSILFHDLLEIYHNCKETDNWYGYEGEEGNIASLGLPKWLQKEFE